MKLYDYYHNLIHFEIDVLYRPKVIGFGIDIGNNYVYMGKAKNIFIEITFLFWTFGIELKW